MCGVGDSATFPPSFRRSCVKDFPVGPFISLTTACLDAVKTNFVIPRTNFVIPAKAGIHLPVEARTHTHNAFHNNLMQAIEDR